MKCADIFRPRKWISFPEFGRLSAEIDLPDRDFLLDKGMQTRQVHTMFREQGSEETMSAMLQFLNVVPDSLSRENVFALL